MSVIEIVSLACLFILFLIMFFVVQNHLVLMQLWQQRAERDIAMMYVQDRASPTPDTPLQPGVGEMAPSHRNACYTPSARSSGVRRKLHRDSDRYTAYGCGAEYIFPSKNCKAPTSTWKRWITHLKKGKRNQSFSFTLPFSNFPCRYFKLLL